MLNHNKMMPKVIRDLLEFISKMSKGHTKQIVRTHKKYSRNELCRCSSGMKYKFCHWTSDVQKGIR